MKNAKGSYMQCLSNIYLILITLGLLCVSCQKENVEKIGTPKKMEIFEDCLKSSYLHSNYLHFIRENNYNNISSSNKEGFYKLVMINTVDYSQIARIILQKDKYQSCPNEEFLILSISAATYLDSIRYWETNLNSWMNPGNSLTTKGWSWNRVWGYVKQFAQADAEAGLETAIGCAILGPVSLEAAFIGAGVGPAFECGKTVAAML